MFHHGEEISYFECSDNKYFGLAKDAGALIISWWVVIAVNFVIHPLSLNLAEFRGVCMKEFTLKQ